MAPSWLPQNIQRRVLRYILDRLALFSNLDTDDLDVQLGTTRSNLSLQNVRLDTDKLSIPGIYVRDGQIGKLDLRLGVASGVEISASDVDLTIALSSKRLDEEEIHSILSRTTADLAKSIIGGSDGAMENDIEELEEASAAQQQATGFGMGDFGGVVNKIIDSALSQVSVSLNHIMLKIVIDDTLTLNASLDHVGFKTENGMRELEISHLEWFIWETLEPDLPESDSESDFDDDANQSLMQSTIYSREEASLYMSALSEAPERHTLKKVLAVVENVSLQFKGIKLSELKVDIAKICISLMPLSDIVGPVMNALANLRAHQKLSQANASASHEVKENFEDLGVFSLDNISLDQLEVYLDNEGIDSGGLPSSAESIVFQASKTEANMTESGDCLITVKDLFIKKGGKLLFSFSNTEEDDLTVHLSKARYSVLLPKTASTSLNIAELNEVLDCIYAYNSALSLAASQKQSLRDESASQEDAGSRLVLKTNTIELEIELPDVLLQISIFPVLFEHGQLSVSNITVKLRGQNNTSSSIDLEEIFFSSSPFGDTSISDGSPIKVNSLLSFSHMKALLHHEILDSLLLALKSIHKPRVAVDFGHGNHQSTSDMMFKVRIDDRKVSSRMIFKTIDIEAALPGKIGTVDISLETVVCDQLADKDELELCVQGFNVSRDFEEEEGNIRFDILHMSNPFESSHPMILIGIGGGEIKDVKFFNITFEYHVKLLKLFEQKGDISELDKRTVENDLQNSVSTIKDSELRFPIYFTNCCVDLNPLDLPSKAILVIRDGNAVVNKSASLSIELVILRASLLLIDNVKSLEPPKPIQRKSSAGWRPFQVDQVQHFVHRGFVSVAQLSASRVLISISDSVKAQLSTELLSLETCADSTQTLIQLINGLKPPLEISESLKYHTEIDPVEVMKDVEAVAFGEGAYSDTEMATHSMSLESGEDLISDDLPTNLDFVESYYGGDSSRSLSGFGRSKLASSSSSSSSGQNGMQYSKADLLLDQDLSSLVRTDNPSGASATALASSSSSESSTGGYNSSRRVALFDHRVHYMGSIDISENYIAATGQDDSNLNSWSDDGYEEVDYTRNNRKPTISVDSGNPPPGKTSSSLFQLELMDSRVIWNLFDGYDWTYTQKAIDRVVQQVEVEAAKSILEKQNGNNISKQTAGSELRGSSASTGPSNPEHAVEDEEQDEPEAEELIGNILFNSIYIGLPNGNDPRSLRQAINREINDDMSETASIATSNRSGRRASYSGSRGERGYGRLRLKRSRRSKVRIELTGLRADIDVIAGVESPLPDNIEGALLNRVKLWIKDLEIIDNVPSSTWKKFLTYMKSAGPRELNSNMVKIVFDTVKPVPTAAVSEAIITVNILPLRLHVDQDTLDFLTRFFEFKDERYASASSPTDEDVFIQKLDVRTTKVKLDYKPKRVDYAGLKSGHTTEFMNFFILDEADIVLKHVVLHGITGFEKVSKLLNGVWMPDIRSTQLGGVLGGLAPVRSLVRLGSGMRDLVVIPVQEYQKDQRMVRGLQKGAATFAKTTTNELVKLGAQIAAGTQSILESAEQAMGGQGAIGSAGRRRKYISPYSDNFDDYIEDDESEDDLDTIVSGGTRRRSPARQDPQHQKAVSHYADQPQGVNEGLRLAYQGLERNLAMAKGAITEIPGEAMERGSAQGAAMAVIKAAPIAIIRPMIGATEAVSKALLGVTNGFDPEGLDESNDVSIEKLISSCIGCHAQEIGGAAHSHTSVDGWSKTRGLISQN